ncbi:hypothetical protein Bca4012_103109 [Brassica carinata]
MIGRADIEGSKSSVAMSGLAATSQLSLCRIPLVVPVLSWLFGAGKARKSRSQSVPGRQAVARHVSGSSSPPTVGGLNWDPEPSPQSQSFSSYGSILPTSLAYIVPSTRGCSPWRPDAVMKCDRAWRLSVLGFSRARECTDTTRRAVLFQPLDPTSG